MRGDFDDFAARRIRVAAINAECDPAGIIAAHDIAELLRRHRGRVEVVHAFVGRIADPHFAFVRREADTVARAAVALGDSDIEALHFDAVQLRSRGEIADFKAEQAVHIHKAERAFCIHREWPDGGAKRPGFPHHLASGGVHDAQDRRAQAREIRVRARGIHDGIVRAGLRRLDAPDDVAARSIHDIPEIFLEGRLVDFLPVGGHGHAVAAAVERLFPEHFFRQQIHARERVRGGNEEALRGGVRADALHVARRALFIRHGKWDALHELVPVIHVEDEHAAAAPSEVVANAGRGDVEQVPFILGR